VALIVPVECAQAVQVHANAPESSPSPLRAAMEAMVVVIATPQVPVAADLHPARTGPATQDAQAIQVTANTTPPSPEPARASVVMVASPQVPVRTHAAPASLMVAIQCAQAVAVNANASEPAPCPSMTAMQVVVVVVPSVQMPVSTDFHPSGTSPPTVDAQPVLMTSDATISTPEPAWPLVITVASPKMPIGSHAAPMALIVTVQSAQTV
jgi:hypothetical protein